MTSISEAVLEREKKVRPFIEKYAKDFKIDPNLVRALITQESRFKGDAVSPTGAFGFGQFTGIGARQVSQNISQMTERAADLVNFTKSEASDPDRGIKAICATLWWLFYLKYKKVMDSKIKLEAVLTFYNSGGKPASLVVQHGGHNKALPFIEQLPANVKSQSGIYAPEVAAWFVAWHDQLRKEKAEAVMVEDIVPVLSPLDEEKTEIRYMALIQALKSLSESDPQVDLTLISRAGFTEINMIFPGELN